MRNLTFKSLTALAVFCMVLGLASPSFAQGRGYSRVNVDRLIRQAENRSDQFVAMFDRALDRSRLEGTIREDRLNERAMELERQLNIVRQEFNRTGNHYNIRSHVANALNAAQAINTVMRNRRLHPTAERQWMLLRSELNRLAAVYNLRQLR
ncbi:MAG TPA: hypothetical protein VF131_10020 [Blastocatellia bacterium]|nr:hypothetical protein [Blastocatellia bacterium]